MIKKRPFASTLIVFVALAAVVCVWLFFVAPTFQEKERQVRSENAALAKDLAEIDAMNGNPEMLESRILETEDFMAKKFASRKDTAEDAVSRIEKICAELGFRPSKIALGQKQMLHPAGVFTPALYSADVTFLVESTEEAGPAVVRALENSKTADFEVTGFVYRSSPPEGKQAAYEGEWIFAATLYYYE